MTIITAHLATWSSRGGKWTALLETTSGGYRLSERKNGDEVGAAFRPETMFANHYAAIAWADEHVKNCFDVAMRRTS